jgi:hypothetical protein
MSFFLTGNVPINSTQESFTDPSTSALLAELDSSNFQNKLLNGPARTYSVNAWVGGSTGALWVCEQATSTAISSGVVVTKVFWRTASGQTSQFVHKFKLNNATDRIRIRHVSSVTGTFDAKLQAEELA